MHRVGQRRATVRQGVTATVATVLLLLVGMVTTPQAGAQPSATITAESPTPPHPCTAMRVDVIPPRDPSAPHPTVYLLNGAQGGLNGSSWLDQTDVVDFFADKNATVVIPVGGQASYFADWRADDPVLGHQKWSTFLTKELPPLMDARFAGDGRDQPRHDESDPRNPLSSGNKRRLTGDERADQQQNATAGAPRHIRE